MRDGGVAVVVKDTFPFKTATILSPEYECLLLRPKLLSRSISKIALACVYLPPSLNSGAIELSVIEANRQYVLNLPKNFNFLSAFLHVKFISRDNISSQSR